jgi:hypothetical protein
MTGWLDKSANATNMSVSGTITVQTGFNGLAAGGVYFGGSAYFYTATAVLTGVYTIFVVFNKGAGNAPLYYTSTGTSGYDGFFPNYNGTMYFSVGNAWYTSTSFPNNVAYLASISYGGTTVGSSANLYKNGTSLLDTTIAVAYTDTFNSFYIGYRPSDSTNYYTGYMYEIIAYSSVLSRSQRQAVEGYLAWKWGVQTISSQNLITGHPSYYTRPFTRGFQPIDMSIPEYWFDAADITTISTSGNYLTTWVNKGSFTGSNITPTTASTATSGTTRYNGNNLINIPSTYRLQYSGYFPNGARARFIVTRQTTAGTVVYLYQGGSSINGYDYVAIESNTLLDVAQGYIVNIQSSTISALNGLVSLITVVNSATSTANNRAALNGSNVSLTTNNGAGFYNTGIITTYIGSTSGTAQDFGEFISYNAELTLQEIYMIEGYLANKWGIQLISTHPFYKVGPSSLVPFNPTTLSGSSLWMDASQDTSANNATITTIPDRSGNGITLTAIGTITLYQNYQNGNPVYYFYGNRASNASFSWGTSFTHFVVSSSFSGGWLNSAGALTTYVGLGNWALASINSSTSFEDPGSITTWTISGSVTTGVNANGLPYVTLPVSTTSGSATTTYTTPINSVRQTSFSLVLPSTAGLYSYFGLTNGTTTLQFLLNTSSGVPSQIYFFFGGNPTLTVSAGSTVLCSITNTSVYMIVYPSGSNVTVSWTSSGAAEYYMFFNVVGNGANANTTTYNNIQFDPAQGGSILPKTTGLANAWNITSVGYTSGSTTLTNYAVNGTLRSSTTSTPYSGYTPLLPLYINGSSTGPYDTSYYAEIIHYDVALTSAQRQQVEGYLAWKWGLQNKLPSTHRYKLFPPGLASSPIIITATGGTITTSVILRYHTFTSSGSFVVTGTGIVNYLIVGGGGGGGDRHGGGGGAGGVVSGTFTVTTGTYTVTVGAGGTHGATTEGGQTQYGSPAGAGSKGGNSSISSVATANGGGGGGTYDGNPSDASLGSGGGGGGNYFAGIAGTSGQGTSGGSGQQPAGGGGGGAGGAGSNANSGNGGIGISTFSRHLLAVGYGTSFATAWVLGNATYYIAAPSTYLQSPIVSGVAYIAAGGGGASYAAGVTQPGGYGGGGKGDWDDENGLSGGTENTGSGGGASRSYTGAGSVGRNGGAGLVLIWYSI